jgi:hypothetical protein
MASHKSAYLVHGGMGLSLPATLTRPSSADKVKGATAMRYIEPAGVVSAVTRRRTIPGMKASMSMTRSERAEPWNDIFSDLSMMCCFWTVLILMGVVKWFASVKLIFDV